MSRPNAYRSIGCRRFGFFGIKDTVTWWRNEDDTGPATDAWMIADAIWAIQAAHVAQFQITFAVDFSSWNRVDKNFVQTPGTQVYQTFTKSPMQASSRCSCVDDFTANETVWVIQSTRKFGGRKFWRKDLGVTHANRMGILSLAIRTTVSLSQRRIRYHIYSSWLQTNLCVRLYE